MILTEKSVRAKLLNCKYILYILVMTLREVWTEDSLRIAILHDLLPIVICVFVVVVIPIEFLPL